SYWSRGACKRRLPNSRDIGCSLSSRSANSNGVGLASDSAIGDVDIIAATGEIRAGGGAKRRVAAAGGVKESIPTDSCVVVPEAIGEKSEAAGRDIVDACGITLE